MSREPKIKCDECEKTGANSFCCVTCASNMSADNYYMRCEIEELHDTLDKCNKKISAITNENTTLKARLSAYEKGIKPEEADKSKEYVAEVYKGEFAKVLWSDLDLYWIFRDVDGWAVCPNGIVRLYPLPPTQEGEE